MEGIRVAGRTGRPGWLRRMKATNMKNLFEVDPWRVIERACMPEKREVAESVFSLANEYMGARGNFEEGSSGPTLEGCYLGGIYGRGNLCVRWSGDRVPAAYFGPAGGAS